MIKDIIGIGGAIVIIAIALLLFFCPTYFVAHYDNPIWFLLFFVSWIPFGFMLLVLKGWIAFVDEVL